MSDNFYLDTQCFDIVIKRARSLAEKMAELKHEMDQFNGELMPTWAGSGCNMYQKKYRLLSQQFGDLKEDLYEIAEEVLEAEEAYIQADTNAAQQLDGTTNRF